VALTLLCCKLLKKGISPIAIILALFAVGICGRFFGFM
jgi:PTS system mannose-specific IID component